MRGALSANARRSHASTAGLLLLALFIAPVSAQFDNVGTISFPTSGSPAAQQHFLRAVAILHSFGWKQAIAEFKQAQKLQPDFAMAYWGETLCYNHPLQAEQDAKTPREVLARLGATPAARLAKAPTDSRERLPAGDRDPVGRGRLARAARRIYERDGAAQRSSSRTTTR